MDQRREPRIRRRPIPGGAKVVVVRGDDATPDSDRSQATAFRRRFSDWGRFGLSAYYAEDDAAVDDLASDLLERFPFLGVYEVVALLDAGFEVVPTFRSPHVTIAFTDLDEGLAALRAVAHLRRQNAYHVPGRRTP